MNGNDESMKFIGRCQWLVIGTMLMLLGVFGGLALAVQANGHFHDDFETVTDDGFPAGNNRNIGDGLVYSDDTTARSGQRSVYVGRTEGSAPNGFGINTALTKNLRGGEAYRITVWYKTPHRLGTDGGQAPFYLRVGTAGQVGPWNPDWVHIDHSRYDLQFGTTLFYVRPLASNLFNADDWHPLTVTVRLPEEFQTFGLIINLYNESRDHVVWFDDLSIQRLDDDSNPFAERVMKPEDRKPGTFYVSPSGSNENPGTFEQPWATVQYAASRAVPGDTILFLPGEYHGVLRPTRSGSAEAPIVFKSLERRQARLVGDAGASHAVDLSGIEYVHVEGFHIRPKSDQGRWMLIDRAKHIRIDDVLMEEARGGIPFTITHSDHVQIRDSVMRIFTGSSHNMVRVSNSNYLLFEGNAISRAGHSPFQFYPDSSSRFVVVRGNVFHAAWGRNFEFFGTRDILFEHNIVTNALDSGRSTSSNAKFTTDHGIFRFNRIFRNWGGPLHLYPMRDVWIKNTRIYNNVFDDNVDYGIAVSDSHSSMNAPSQMKDNVFINNVFSRNDKDGVGRHINVADRDPEIVRFTRNVFAADHPSGIGQIYSGGVPVSVDMVQGGGGTGMILPGLNSGQFIDNLDVLPEFAAPDLYNHTLKDTSLLRSAGYPLTFARGAGEGYIIHVEDAAYFYDGFGIEGEVGDWLSIGTADQRARVVHVDYERNTITLDRDVRWNDGAPVSLSWSGEAPDIGVYEHGPTGRPTIHVVAEPFLVRPGEEVRLSARILGMSDEPAEIRWQLGDGTLAFGDELIHRYDEPYDYPIRVRVTTKSGEVLRGTGYVVVERPKEVGEPFLHSTFDQDDADWWWQWKPYTPTPTEYAHEVDDQTGNGVLRLTNPGGGVIPLRVAPPQWDIDRYPWIYLRYRVSDGAPIGLFLDTFDGGDAGNNRVWVAASPKGRLNPSGRSARYELIDDGQWHTLLLDARTIRIQRPDATSLRRLGLWALGASQKGDTYWIDEVAILPQEALDLPEWEDKLKNRQVGHVDILSPKDRAVVSGEVVLDLAFETYDAPICQSCLSRPQSKEVPIDQLEVAIDGQIIFSDTAWPDVGKLRIHTEDLTEGTHDLTVTAIDNQGQTIQRSIAMTVRNRQLMIDRLKAPEKWTFFGEEIITDRSMTSDESDGWAYVEDLDIPRFEHVSGRVKSKDTLQYLMWDAPDLRSFSIVVYSTQDTIDGIVRTMIDTGGGQWVDLPFDIQRMETVGDDNNRWNRFTISGEQPLGSKSISFQLQVGPGATAYQFGVEEVTLDIRTF